MHVELTPGVVTILPAWKLDPVFCAGLKIGAPLVSLTALASLHELLVALESRLPSADGTAVTEEAHHGITDIARTGNRACSEAAERARDSTWDRHVGLTLDPDRRLQEVIRLVFQKFQELGSARQVLLWMAAEGLHFPYPTDGRTLTSFEWRPIRYRNVIAILKNPFYAGVYAYGKSEKRTEIVDGRARKSYGHRKPMDAWEVFIKDHHEGYIDWAEFERNQAVLAGNAYGKAGDTKSGRGGRALVAGLICCARCGRRLTVAYRGRSPLPVYKCDRPNL